MRVGSDKFAINFFAFFREQLFRVVQLPVPEFLRKNDSGSYDWSRQRAPARFVDPRNRGDDPGRGVCVHAGTHSDGTRGENTETQRN